MSQTERRSSSVAFVSSQKTFWRDMRWGRAHSPRMHIYILRYHCSLHAGPYRLISAETTLKRWGISKNGIKSSNEDILYVYAESCRRVFFISNNLMKQNPRAVVALPRLKCQCLNYLCTFSLLSSWSLDVQTWKPRLLKCMQMEPLPSTVTEPQMSMVICESWLLQLSTLLKKMILHKYCD